VPIAIAFLSLENDNLVGISFNNLDFYHNIPKWYHKNVIYELATIKNNIDTIKHNETRDFLLVAFSSILRSVSNATSGFGNLMINKNAPPKDRIFEKFSIAVKNMIQGMSDFPLRILGIRSIRAYIDIYDVGLKRSNFGDH